MGNMDGEIDDITGGDDVDHTMVRQLVHNHNQLMAEKKRMEEYFDEVETESSQKNIEIDNLKDKLSKMKMELETARIKASNDRAEARALAAEEEREAYLRSRRTLPKCPSKKRINATTSGDTPGVVAVDTTDLSREELIAEIRSLESDLEYKHQQAMKFEDELEHYKQMYEAGEHRARSNGTAEGIDRDVGRNEESLDGASIIVLPDNRQYLSDILDTCEVPPTFASVVNGVVECVVLGVAEICDQAKLAADLESTAVDLQHRATAAETECTHLQDIIDELHHELEIPDSDSIRVEQLSPEHDIAVIEPLVLDDHGGESLAEALSPLGDSLGMEMPGSASSERVMELENDNALLKSKVKRLDKTRASDAQKIAAHEKTISDLEDTIAANREVMGMTVEEQVVMLGEQIKLKIGLDELGEEKRELDHSLKKAKWDFTMLKSYCENRDELVYGLLEKSIKAKDRKSLLKLLKDTAMGTMSLRNANEATTAALEAARTPTSTPTTTSWFGSSTPRKSAPQTPPLKRASISGAATPAAASKLASGTGARTPLSGPSHSMPSTASSSPQPTDTPAGRAVRRASTSGTPRAAPAARAFPEHLLKDLSLEEAPPTGTPMGTPTQRGGGARQPRASAPAVLPLGTAVPKAGGSGPNKSPSKSTPKSTTALAKSSATRTKPALVCTGTQDSTGAEHDTRSEISDTLSTGAQPTADTASAETAA